MMNLSPPPQRIDPFANYLAILNLASDQLVFQLFSAKVTTLVNSFIYLATKHQYYNGTKFHRVVDGLVIQGGDREGTGEGGPGYYLKDEFSDFCHHPGTLSLANCGPDTNGSQFFITLVEAPWLDRKYCVIGQATSGLETLGKVRVGDVIKEVTIREHPHGDPLSWEKIESKYNKIIKEQSAKGKSGNK
jgi:cyclophilin family peptidyl-prolyl cis-trans isomerase